MRTPQSNRLQRAETTVRGSKPTDRYPLCREQAWANDRARGVRVPQQRYCWSSRPASWRLARCL
eukprot:6506403-Prymnesium_polylepis.1